MWVKSIICRLLSVGVLDDVRSVLGHDEGSVRKLVGCS